MKRGSKLFLVDTVGNTAGPFGWTLVREWFALSLIPSNAWVFVQGEASWRSLSEFADLYTLPKSLTNLSGSVGHHNSAERYRRPAMPTQSAYLCNLGCPFSCANLDMYLAAHVIGTLVAEFPERADPGIQAEIERKKDELTDWRNELATERQIQYLASIGVYIEPNLTKGGASQLIDPPSEGQLRRLRFYDLQPPAYLTKRDASYLIDKYIQSHPELEEQYQTWKLQNGVA